MKGKLSRFTGDFFLKKRIRSFLLESEGVKSFPVMLQEKEVRV